jgi:hypothetical protein
MKHEDIKVGEVYNVRVRVVDVDDDTGEITTETANENGYALGFEWCYYAPGEVLAFTPITAENGIKNAEPAPKHDPCRRFKKGDKVRLIAHRGRIAYYEGLQYPPDRTVFIVEHDELKDGIVSIYEQPECDFDAFDIHFSFLELVTPVEALEPYSVETCQYGYTVNKGELILATYNDEYHPHAKEAAEAECARLKAEYRKENSHE